MDVLKTKLTSTLPKKDKIKLSRKTEKSRKLKNSKIDFSFKKHIWCSRPSLQHRLSQIASFTINFYNFRNQEKFGPYADKFA